MSDTNNKSWMEHLRLVTPFLIVVLGFYVNGMNNSIIEVKTSINSMQAELFHHLTNSDLHMPRASVTSKDEFVIYQAMRDKQMADLKEELFRIEAMLEKHMEK
jgi:hypothetical protein